MTASAALARLLLADGRFPSGAHAHSTGLESAVAAGLVRDLDDLGAWITGVLHAGWHVDAAVAVLASRLVVAGADDRRWTALDAEAVARLTSPELRAASRTLGRQLLRAGSAAWPTARAALPPVGAVHGDGPLVAMAHGALAAGAGLTEDDAAFTLLHGAVLGATTAAVRLLGLDPYAILGLVTALGPAVAGVAEGALAVADDPALLPAGGAPLLDLLLHDHATTEVRFFAT